MSYLDELVPTSGNDHGVGGVGAEADAGDPVGVALVGDGVLAVTEGVPELDGTVAGTGDDLAVVGREGNRENVVGVTDEAAGGLAGRELPETEGLVPGGGEGVGTIGGDNAVGDDVRVALEATLGDTVAGLIAGAVRKPSSDTIPHETNLRLSAGSSYRSQMIKVLSREPDKSMLGFSREVARHYSSISSTVP